MPKKKKQPEEETPIVEEALEAEEVLQELSEEQEAENRFQFKRIIEAVLFASPDPLPFNKIKDVILSVEEGMNAKAIRDLLDELKVDYENERRAFGLEEIGDGYVLRSKPEFSPYLDQVFRNKKVERLSPSATEVLAIIAYRQPLTRPQIEAIRGVDSSGVLASLMERGLVEAVGKLEAPGRPTLYGTSKVFLEHYGLKDVKDLPDFGLEVAPQVSLEAPEDNIKEDQPDENSLEVTAEEVNDAETTDEVSSVDEISDEEAPILEEVAAEVD